MQGVAPVLQSLSGDWASDLNLLATSSRAGLALGLRPLDIPEVVESLVG